MATVSRVEFLYSERQEPVELVQELSPVLLTPVPAPRLLSRGVYQRLESAQIENVGACLTPTRCVVVLTAPKAGLNACTGAWRIEPWFKSAYRTQELDVALVERWREAVEPALHLPLQNELVPTEFKLLHHANTDTNESGSESGSECGSESERWTRRRQEPELIADDGRCATWYRPTLFSNSSSVCHLTDSVDGAGSCPTRCSCVLAPIAPCSFAASAAMKRRSTASRLRCWCCALSAPYSSRQILFTLFLFSNWYSSSMSPFVSYTQEFRISAPDHIIILLFYHISFRSNYYPFPTAICLSSYISPATYMTAKWLGSG